MWVSVLAIIVGLAVLVWGADRFVVGAAATAYNLGIPPLVIGITVVGFGTSAPEMLVSVFAAWHGNPALAVGNAVGSNIANIALILGCSALITPLTVQSKVLRKELPLLLAVMLFALLLLHEGHLGFIDGWILLAGLLVVMIWVTVGALHARPDDPIAAEFEQELPTQLTTGQALGWLSLGLLLLLGSSRLLVWGAVNVAQALGVSDLVIGLTIVAVGTSLPELAASIAGAIKDEHDIAVGNVIGSNIFNTLGVLALPGIIHPTELPAEVLQRDYWIMLGLTIALFLMAYGWGGAGRISRAEGATLLGCFVLYQTLIYLDVRG